MIGINRLWCHSGIILYHVTISTYVQVLKNCLTLFACPGSSGVNLVHFLTQELQHSASLHYPLLQDINNMLPVIVINVHCH